MELKKHVITGGPCSGKTTTVEALRRRGFGIIEEASRKIIEEQVKNGGDLVPWKRLADFNVAVTHIQKEFESRVSDGVYFLDRGVIDNFAYCELGGIEPPSELSDVARKTKYNKIFLLLPLGFMEKDSARRESREDAEKLTKLIEKAYMFHGYKVIAVPPVSVEERVEFILKEINATSE